MKWKWIQKEQTSVALYRIRESQDGNFRVVHSHFTCGQEDNGTIAEDRWNE